MNLFDLNDPLVKSRLLKWREDIATAIDKNPVYHQYVSHINSRSVRSVNDKPWHAIGERLYATWLALHASLTENNIAVHGISPEAPREVVITMLGVMLYHSTPYLWSDKMERLADAAPLPKHVISNKALPMPMMFWSRETAYVDRQRNSENNWVGLFWTPDRILVVGDETVGDGSRASILTADIPFGKVWPDDFVDQGDRGCERVLKRCAFLNSSYIGTETHKLPRHQRRQMEREGVATKEQVEEQIHVVTLRRPATKEANPEPSGESPDWKHQWWVSGHYRAQWYPTEQSHKVVWIAPYLKGPEGLPVLEKMFSVVR